MTGANPEKASEPQLDLNFIAKTFFLKVLTFFSNILGDLIVKN